MIAAKSSVKTDTLLLMALSLVICLLCFAPTYLLSAWQAAFSWALICVLAVVIVSDSIKCTIPNRCVLSIILIWIMGKFFLFTSAVVPCIGSGGSYAFGTLSNVTVTAKGIFAGIAGDAVSGLLISGMALVVSFFTGKLIHRKAMGSGDIKLLFALGMFLGFSKSLFMLLLACIFGLVIAFVSLYKGRTGHFPFGPAISFAAAIVVLS